MDRFQKKFGFCVFSIRSFKFLGKRMVSFRWMTVYYSSFDFTWDRWYRIFVEVPWLRCCQIRGSLGWLISSDVIRVLSAANFVQWEEQSGLANQGVWFRALRTSKYCLLSMASFSRWNVPLMGLFFIWTTGANNTNLFTDVSFFWDVQCVPKVARQA